MKKIFLVFGILVLLLAAGCTTMIGTTPAQSSGDLLKATYYDKDGKIIGTDSSAMKQSSGLFAVEQLPTITRRLKNIPREAVTAVYEITFKNEGNVPVQVTIDDAYFEYRTQ